MENQINLMNEKLLLQEIEKKLNDKKELSYSQLFNLELRKNSLLDRIDYIENKKSNFRALNFFKKECYLKALNTNQSTCKFLIIKENIFSIINFSFIVENGIFQIAIKPLDRDNFLIQINIDTSKMKNSEIRFLNLNYGLQVPLNVEAQLFDEYEKTLLLENNTNLF